MFGWWKRIWAKPMDEYEIVSTAHVLYFDKTKKEKQAFVDGVFVGVRMLEKKLGISASTSDEASLPSDSEIEPEPQA